MIGDLLVKTWLLFVVLGCDRDMYIFMQLIVTFTLRQKKASCDAMIFSYHYANMSVQYIAIFHECKNDNFPIIIFLIFF